MTGISDLPGELLLAIFKQVGLDDIVSISRTNRAIHNFFIHNESLYHDLYLENFDAPPTQSLDWEREIKDFIRLKKICVGSYEKKKEELPFVYETVKRILSNAERPKADVTEQVLSSSSRFRNATILGRLLGTADNEEMFLGRSLLFERIKAVRNGAEPRMCSPPDPQRQMTAELHCLYGKVLLQGRVDMLESDTVRGVIRTHPYAASIVYDMRHNTPRTHWGPFWDDGSDKVDWEMVEAILIDIRANLKYRSMLDFPTIAQHWDRAFFGSWPGSFVQVAPDPILDPSNFERNDLMGGSESPQAEAEAADASDATKQTGTQTGPDADGVVPSGPSSKLEDPYGVTGTWMRIVCFVDYSDFFTFNFQIDADYPSDKPQEPLVRDEELRLIAMKLYVSEVVPPLPGDHPDYPRVLFKGTSHAMDNRMDGNANSDLEGICRVTKNGDVRWTTFSIINGERRWKSESVQVGGIGSGRGVIGNWFDVGHDPHGPCGPTAFWKIDTGRPEEGPDLPKCLASYMIGTSRHNVDVVFDLDHPLFQYDDDEDDEDDEDYLEESTSDVEDEEMTEVELDIEGFHNHHDGHGLDYDDEDQDDEGSSDDGHGLHHHHHNGSYSIHLGYGVVPLLESIMQAYASQNGLAIPIPESPMPDLEDEDQTAQDEDQTAQEVDQGSSSNTGNEGHTNTAEHTDNGHNRENGNSGDHGHRNEMG